MPSADLCVTLLGAVAEGKITFSTPPPTHAQHPHRRTPKASVQAHSPTLMHTVTCPTGDAYSTERLAGGDITPAATTAAAASRPHRTPVLCVPVAIALPATPVGP